MQITGSTRYYAQLADPVAHVRFPQLFQPVLDRLGQDIAAVPIHVRPAGLEAVVEGLRAWENLLGVGVTMPHKEAVVALLDGTSRQAGLVGAVNLVRREADGRLVGTMIDGLGFVAGLRARGCDPRGMAALLVGAGGTARAIAFALAEAGVSGLTIANRTPAKAEGLAREIAAAYPDCRATAGVADPRGHGLVVNATKLGMAAEDALPVDVTGIDAGMVVADVVMVPAQTALLAAAAERGAVAVGGRAMIEPQIPLVIEFLGLTTAAEPALRGRARA